MSIYIGIDPDCDKSGMAAWDTKKKELIWFKVMKFWDIYDIFIREGQYLSVIVEAGWLSPKSNWHNERQGARLASRIGKNVGANHQVGKLIAEMCDYLKIPYQLVMPQGKIDAKNFERITGIKKSNQDLRDAVMLVWGR